tara:strand:- start:548 stop:892 length:345 start_codon:yes stop_codon:yes gene_type:complete
MGVTTYTAIAAAAAVYGAYTAEETRKDQKKAAKEQKAAQEKALAEQKEQMIAQEQEEDLAMANEMADEKGGPSLKTAAQTKRSTRMRRDTLTPKGLSIPTGPTKSGLNIGYART